MSQVFEIKILYVEDDKKLNEEYQKVFLRKCDKLFVAYNGLEGFVFFCKKQT